MHPVGDFAQFRRLERQPFQEPPRPQPQGDAHARAGAAQVPDQQAVERGGRVDQHPGAEVLFEPLPVPVHLRLVNHLGGRIVLKIVVPRLVERHGRHIDALGNRGRDGDAFHSENVGILDGGGRGAVGTDHNAKLPIPLEHIAPDGELNLCHNPLGIVVGKHYAVDGIATLGRGPVGIAAVGPRHRDLLFADGERGLKRRAVNLCRRNAPARAQKIIDNRRRVFCPCGGRLSRPCELAAPHHKRQFREPAEHPLVVALNLRQLGDYITDPVALMVDGPRTAGRVAQCAGSRARGRAVCVEHFPQGDLPRELPIGDGDHPGGGAADVLFFAIDVETRDAVARPFRDGIDNPQVGPVGMGVGEHAPGSRLAIDVAGRRHRRPNVGLVALSVEVGSRRRLGELFHERDGDYKLDRRGRQCLGRKKRPDGLCARYQQWHNHVSLPTVASRNPARPLSTR